ncbi:MAG: metal ABC transporter ATP-binding protein [Chloroflexi bacterium]|nr:metal ABC transporter ATP-binding protein [Chloroflexota bacterium]
MAHEIVPGAEPRAGVKALAVEGLAAGYDSHPALEDVTFAVEPGTIVGVVGPNGAGKSTLFRAILGLVRPWRGSVQVYGHRGHTACRLIGYMPQMEEVDWHFPVTAEDVVMMGRYTRLGPVRRPGPADRQAVQSALEQVGGWDLRQRQIGELSGGQQRRVLIARALAQEPQVLLLDEPVAGLDATAQHQLLGLLDRLRRDGRTVVLSTHDLSCVASSCDLALCLNRTVIAYGPPREVLRDDVLNATFQSHLLVFDAQGRIYVTHRSR